MRKIERLYKLAKKYGLRFYFHESPESVSANTISKTGLIFDYTEQGNAQFLYVAQKGYDDFDSALSDYEELLILHGE